MAIKVNIGKLPKASADISAKGYVQGPQGPKGDRGEPGPKGDDYILTEADKAEIAAEAAAHVNVPTKISELTNDSSFVTQPTVNTMVTSAVQAMVQRMDTKDADVLAEAKAYADEHGGGGSVDHINADKVKLLAPFNTNLQSGFTTAWGIVADLQNDVSSNTNNIISLTDDVDTINGQITDLYDTKADADSVLAVNLSNIDEEGTQKIKDIASESASGVDVQINGTSITVDGVANIPHIDEYGKLGLVKVSQATYGLDVNRSTGELRVSGAKTDQISSRQNITRPIIPPNLDYAVKAAMTDGKGAEWSGAEKEAGRQRLGIVTLSQEEYDLIEVKDENTLYIPHTDDRITEIYLGDKLFAPTEPILLCDYTTTEVTNELKFDTVDGVPVERLRKHSIVLTLSIPANSAQTNTNGSVWIFATSNRNNQDVRYIATVAGWKTASRQYSYKLSVYKGVFLTTMGATSNVNSSLDCVKGLTLYIQQTVDHFPIGTRVVAYLVD